MDHDDANASPLARALRVYLAELEVSESVDVDVLCARHPRLASELRSLHLGWQEIARILDVARRTDSLAQRIARHYGGPVDPAIDLATEESGATPPEGELIARLATRAGSSGRYHPRGELGRGGMGVVLRVWDEDLRRHLAMKLVLPPERGGGHSSTEQRRAICRFLEEAQITGQLDHPGIVPVHELGIDAEGRAYFTMKLVRGESLARIFERVRDGVAPWSLARAVGVLVKVCEAMAYAHDKGVAHRDLKPANVMVGRFGEVYVTDWGLARVLGRPSSEEAILDVDDAEPPSHFETVRSHGAGDSRSSPVYTFHGQVLGTPAYMCPEQAAGRVDEVSRAWDVYSLGAMLYHLLSGEHPYEEKGARAGGRQVLAQVLAGPPRDVLEIATAAPAELAAVCRKAMSRLPADRYASAEQLGEDLRSWLEGRVVSAYSSGRWARTRKWVRRNRAPVAVILSALVVTISGWTASTTLLAARNRSLEQKQLDSDDRFRARLEEEALDLGPAVPANLGEYEDWVERAREFASRMEREHRAQFALLRAARGERVELSNPVVAVARAAPSVPEDAAAERQSPVARLEEFAGVGGVVERIENALAIARSLEPTAALDGGSADRWKEACDSIADVALSPAYSGMHIEPQWGLIPLFQDQDTGLWEFVHLASGRTPSWDGENACFRCDADSGVVLVLIPGGHTLLGAEPSLDIWRHRADVAAKTSMSIDTLEDLNPVDEVVLDPFLISKYELTQAQWLRMARRNPSSAPAGHSYESGEVTWLHPVENVSRREALHVLELMGLTLPTEAQWESAARGGTDGSWWTGSDPDSLQGEENLADVSLRRWHGEGGDVESWNDGFPLHAPIGSFAPNPFGLHDVIGNVEELCLDWFDGRGDYVNIVRAPRAPATGERISRSRAACVVRGGSFEARAGVARVHRGEVLPLTSRLPHAGVRPARLLDPGSWRR